MKQVYKSILLVLFCLSLFATIQANILYVKPGAGSSAWQGKSNVYSDLQAALADAVSGDQIWVAGGIYKPTNGTDRTISFQLKDGVELYGGFAGTETALSQRNWRLNETILSGDIGAVGDNTDNSYNVLTAIGTVDNPISTETIFDGFIVEGGYADLRTRSYFIGGGMYLIFASPMIRNVWFRDNFTIGYGGAVFNHTISTSVFANVIFTNNHSNGSGGAVNVNSGVSFVNCLWHSNTSGDTGGAVYAGGHNNLIVNSILWGNREVNSGPNNMSQITYSIVEGRPDEFRNNISDNPWFIDPENNDFRLAVGSPAVGAGNVASVPQWLLSDYVGMPRIDEGKVNLGPLQGAVETPVTSYPHNNEYFSADVTTLELFWMWNNVVPENHAHYLVEYSINGNGAVQSEPLTETVFELSGLNPLDLVSWRVASVDDVGARIWTLKSEFRIRRGHPIYVKPDGTGDGSSWESAGGLSLALNIALPSDEIWVSAGTYKPTNDNDRIVSFRLKDKVELYGGFAGDETSRDQRNWYLNKTILSGNIGEPDVDIDNSYHVVAAIGTADNPITTETIFDGFIVEQGYADFSSNNNHRGGGMYLSFASPIIRNVWFRDNFATSFGGAIYYENPSASVFVNVIFTNNRSNAHGGAVYVNSGVSFVNCLWHNNYSGDWGGLFMELHQAVQLSTQFCGIIGQPIARTI